jgi:glutaredoxin
MSLRGHTGAPAGWRVTMTSTRPITLYTAPGCAHSDAARSFLEARGDVFAEKDVTATDAAMREMLQRSGQSLTPTVIVGDVVLVGFDAQRVEEMLTETLEPLPPPPSYEEELIEIEREVAAAEAADDRADG